MILDYLNGMAYALGGGPHRKGWLADCSWPFFYGWLDGIRT